jgi:hypothetical protein
MMMDATVEITEVISVGTLANKAEATSKETAKEMAKEMVTEASTITITAGGIGMDGLAGESLFLFCPLVCLLILCHQAIQWL